MAKATDRESRVAFKKGTTYGTAVVCGASSGVLMNPFGFTRKAEPVIDKDSLGNPFNRRVGNGLVSVDGGDIGGIARYDGLDLLIALALGATNGVPVQQGATAAYYQKFTMANRIEGLFATLAYLNGVTIEEVPSLKILGLTLKGKIGGLVEFVFHTLAGDVVFDSIINTPTTFLNVTIFEPENPILFSHGVFRLNNQSGSALADGDKVYPNEFELKILRKAGGVHGVGGVDVIDEPTETENPEASLKLIFPRFTDTAHLLAFKASTLKKMDITFTGKLIADTYYRKFKLSFPELAYDEASIPKGGKDIPQNIGFICNNVFSDSPGMTGIAGPVQIDVTNRQSANVLA